MISDKIKTHIFAHTCFQRFILLKVQQLKLKTHTSRSKYLKTILNCVNLVMYAAL